MNEIDLHKITDLNCLISLADGNKGFVTEMIRTFIAENPKEVNDLEKGISEENFDLIRSSAHRMKSTIPFVGIDMIIGPEISKIEKLAKEYSDLQKIETLFVKVKDICTKAALELSEELNTR